MKNAGSVTLGRRPRRTLLAEVEVPVETGRELRRFRAGHEVEELVRIALLHAGQGGLRERRLEIENVRRVLRGRLRWGAQKVEDPLNVGHVLVRISDALLIGLGVVVAIGQAQAARGGEGDDPRRVREVLIRAETEEEAAALGGQMHAAEVGGERRLRGEIPDLLEFRLQGCAARAIDGRGVHARAVVVADLRFGSGARGRRRARRLEQASEELVVLVGEFSVNAPSGLVRGNGIVLHPSAADVLIEVDARIGGPVHRRNIEARRVGLGGGRSLVFGTRFPAKPEDRQERPGHRQESERASFSPLQGAV